MKTTQVLWNKEINDIKESGYLNNNLSVTDALIENFYQEIMTDEDKVLMNLVLSDNPTQEELDELLKTWDIETKQGNKSLLLAYLLKFHPELHATEYEEPRLKGLLLNFRFRNLKTIAHYTKIGKELNKNNITPMIIKGGVMKYLRPELSRVMGDIDVVVPEADWIKAADIAVSLGYRYDNIDIHSIDIHPGDSDSLEGILDIHRYIYFETGKEEAWLKGLYERAQEKVVFGVKSLVPCFEDLMFITLTNLSRNLRNQTSQAGLLFSLFDCKFFLSKPDFNWEIVKENAALTNTQVQINFALKFIDKISSHVFSEEFRKNIPFEKETNDYSRAVLYNMFYLEDIRTKCRAMKLFEILKQPNKWGEYVSSKAQYVFLKSLKKHPRLIEFFIKDLNKAYNVINKDN